MGLTHDISTIKQQYRELFPLAHRKLLDLFSQLRLQYHCTECLTEPTTIDEILHAGCGYRRWQEDAILTLEQTIGKQICDSLEHIKAQREEVGQCHQCGVCCNLASSEFDMATLKAKAEQGDYFARQFTSVFLPYESPEAARAKFPSLVSEILEQTDGEVYFYHCPHLTENNQCGLYGDPRRPQICDDYPETPLILMYKHCGYQPWKSELLPTTLLAHATLELCQFYANKILEAVKAPGPSLDSNSG